jgi:putative endonuclease
MAPEKIEKSTKQSNTWILYILKCSDQSLYTGITNRLEVRIRAHQKGTGARYTRGRLPVTLVYTEDCTDRSDASKRECAVKKLSKSKKILLVNQKAMYIKKIKSGDP